MAWITLAFCSICHVLISFLLYRILSWPYVAIQFVCTGIVLVTAFFLRRAQIAQSTQPSVASLQETIARQNEALSARESAGDERFRLALEASPNAILVADADGKITFVNAQTEAIFGYSRDELLQAPLEMLVPHAARKAHLGHVKGFREDPQMRAMGGGREVRGLRKDGREFPAEIALGPFRFDGRLRVIAFIADITARKIADKHIQDQSTELARSNQDLELFAYAASHDLQEPLRGIMGYLQLFQRQYKDHVPEKGQHFLTQAIDSGHRMKGLMDALLEYSRVGRQFNPVFVDLNHLLSDIRNDLHASIAETGISLEIQALPSISGDLFTLRQIFQNLISNAAKFRSKENPLVVVGCREENRETLFFVRDNGIGIPLEYQNRLFMLFQRLHARGTYPGSGVGLALVAKAVRAMNGKIWVDSKEGQGSTFYFTLGSQNFAPRLSDRSPAEVKA
jgi:PAS domain S-box-containing protein